MNETHEADVALDMNDDAIRTEVDRLLTRAFALLSSHTHGDARQGALLADAQADIASATRAVRAVKQGGNDGTS